MFVLWFYLRFSAVLMCVDCGFSVFVKVGFRSVLECFSFLVLVCFQCVFLCWCYAWFEFGFSVVLVWL